MEELSKDALAQIALPKWPALIVMGERVTRDQAMEILIRTDDFMFMSNDREWDRQLCEAAGMEFDGTFAKLDSAQAAREKYHVLRLGELTNHRIVSSYIGGPHGWCDWDGAIFCNSYNVGKWSITEGVLGDWEKLAEAFPYLVLKSQLLSGEHTEDDASPLVEFHIQDGTAKAYEPESLLAPTVSDVSPASIAAIFTNPYRERGCTIEQFKEALGVVVGRQAGAVGD